MEEFKETNGERSSSVVMPNKKRKLQSAIDFLSTYSLAFLIIAILLAILFIFVGIPKSTIPPQCTAYSGFTCVDAVYSINQSTIINGTSTKGSRLFINIIDGSLGTVNISSFDAAIGEVKGSGGCKPSTLTNGDTAICWANFSVTPALNNIYTGTYNISANYCPPSSSTCAASSTFTYGGAVTVLAGTNQTVSITTMKFTTIASTSSTSTTSTSTISSSTTSTSSTTILSPIKADGYLYCIGGGKQQLAFTSASKRSKNNISSNTSFPIKFISVNSESLTSVNSTFSGILSSNSIKAWVAEPNYPINSSSLSCITSNSYIYCVGGFDSTSSINTNKVYSANINGYNISNWVSQTSYPYNFSGNSCVAYDNYTYCVGGDGLLNNRNASPVYSASLNKGNVGSWSQQSNYPTNNSELSCTAYAGYIYCIGGNNAIYNNTFNDFNVITTNSVYSAPINNSLVGSWSKQNNYPISANEACTASNKYIYCIGGTNAFDVYSAQISNGVVGTWTNQSNYPLSLSSPPSCVSYENHTYCMDGEEFFGQTNLTAGAQARNGNIANWTNQTNYTISVSALSCTTNQTSLGPSAPPFTTSISTTSTTTTTTTTSFTTTINEFECTGSAFCEYGGCYLGNNVFYNSSNLVRINNTSDIWYSPPVGCNSAVGIYAIGGGAGGSGGTVDVLTSWETLTPVNGSYEEITNFYSKLEGGGGGSGASAVVNDFLSTGQIFNMTLGIGGSGGAGGIPPNNASLSTVPVPPGVGQGSPGISGTPSSLTNDSFSINSDGSGNVATYPGTSGSSGKNSSFNNDYIFVLNSSTNKVISAYCPTFTNNIRGGGGGSIGGGYGGGASSWNLSNSCVPYHIIGNASGGSGGPGSGGVIYLVWSNNYMTSLICSGSASSAAFGSPGFWATPSCATKVTAEFGTNYTTLPVIQGQKFLLFNTPYSTSSYSNIYYFNNNTEITKMSSLNWTGKTPFISNNSYLYVSTAIDWMPGVAVYDTKNFTPIELIPSFGLRYVDSVIPPYAAGGLAFSPNDNLLYIGNNSKSSAIANVITGQIIGNSNFTPPLTPTSALSQNGIYTYSVANVYNLTSRTYTPYINTTITGTNTVVDSTTPPSLFGTYLRSILVNNNTIYVCDVAYVEPLYYPVETIDIIPLDNAGFPTYIIDMIYPSFTATSPSFPNAFNDGYLCQMALLKNPPIS